MPSPGRFFFFNNSTGVRCTTTKLWCATKASRGYGLRLSGFQRVMGPRAVHGPSPNTKLLAQSESIPTQTQLRIILDTKDGSVSLNSE